MWTKQGWRYWEKRYEQDLKKEKEEKEEKEEKGKGVGMDLPTSLTQEQIDALSAIL